MSADNSSLLPPPNGSSMAMQVNARTHSEPFMAFHIPLPRPSMLIQSFHMLWLCEWVVLKKVSPIDDPMYVMV